MSDWLDDLERLRAAAQAVLDRAEPDDDFEGSLLDYLVPADAIAVLRAALAAEPTGATSGMAASDLRAALDAVAERFEDLAQTSALPDHPDWTVGSRASFSLAAAKVRAALSETSHDAT